jgi:acetate kinase
VRVLCIDRGSSSLKIAVYEIGDGVERRILEGGVDRLGVSGVALSVRDYRDAETKAARKVLDGAEPVAAVLPLLLELGLEIDAVGHRIVFGGPALEQPTRVSEELLTSLSALVPFDRLHLPAALAAIREIEAAQPRLPQVVCFDTAFHHPMPMVAQRLPLPRELWAEGVRRYGFHGLSYESVVQQLGDDGVRGKTVIAHLGSGASLAALRDGRPVDTTMGLTALGGVMMGTRPGDLDPGVMLYLLREGRYTLAELDDVLTERSGLLGVSGISDDMRTLLQRRGDDPTAAEAIELFIYEVKKQTGALCAALGGLDTLVFTGGIGERAPQIRWEIALGLEHLGVELDPDRNAAGAPVVSREGSRVIVRVIPARENLVVAQHTSATILASAAVALDRAIYPWILEPELSNAIWGGSELVTTYGKRGDAGSKLGESWECWDDDTVTNGPLRGASVATLRERLGARLLGDLDAHQIFPILTKIITAHDWLSVQVHPDDAYAQSVEGKPFGKTECWYVMAAEPGAELVVGWSRDTSREEYERRVADGTLAEILRKVPVKAGDTFYVPAGLVHAIGPGVTIFETQQAGDITYRMFDWNRLGLDGKPRELNVHKAGDVLDYHAHAEAALGQLDYRLEGVERTALIADPRFTVERIVATTRTATLPTNGRPLIVMSLDHAMQIECAGTATGLQRYQTALVPAAAGSCSVRCVQSSASFLIVTPPDSPERLVARLQAAEIPRERIDAFLEQFAARHGAAAASLPVEATT